MQYLTITITQRLLSSVTQTRCIFKQKMRALFVICFPPVQCLGLLTLNISVSTHTNIQCMHERVYTSFISATCFVVVWLRNELTPSTKQLIQLWGSGSCCSVVQQVVTFFYLFTVTTHRSFKHIPTLIHSSFQCDCIIKGNARHLVYSTAPVDSSIYSFSSKLTVVLTRSVVYSLHYCRYISAISCRLQIYLGGCVPSRG